MQTGPALFFSFFFPLRPVIFFTGWIGLWGKADVPRKTAEEEINYNLKRLIKEETLMKEPNIRECNRINLSHLFKQISPFFLETKCKTVFAITINLFKFKETFTLLPGLQTKIKIRCKWHNHLPNISVQKLGEYWISAFRPTQTSASLAHPQPKPRPRWQPSPWPKQPRLVLQM